MVFLILVFVMLFFPTAPAPTAQSMNWTILVFGTILVAVVVFYAIRQRFRYKSPVQSVGDTDKDESRVVEVPVPLSEK